MPPGTNQKRRPISLVAGATAAARRAVVGAVAVNGAPPAAHSGFPVVGAQKGHIVVKHDGVTVSYRVWVRLDFSGEWALHPTLGTVTVALADSPGYKPVDLFAVDRAYVEITVATGPFTNGIDVWIAGNSQ